MSDLLNLLAHLDKFTWVCVASVAAFGSSLISIQVGSWLMSLIYFPGIAAGALAFRVETMRRSIAAHIDKDVDTIIMTATGGMMALLVLFLLTRIMTSMLNWMTPAPKSMLPTTIPVSRRI